MDVYVSHCLAWAPGLSTDAEWCAWAAGRATAAAEGVPAANAVPPMLRRRLTPWGRLALEVASGLAEQLHPEAPVIFSSRHGDTERSLALLQDLALGEPLSPNAFSLSVHNASLGLFTILRQIRSPSLALAAGKETFAEAWVEALTWLDQGAPQVLLVHADQPLSGFHAEDVDEEDFPHGIALLLSRSERGNGAGQKLELQFSARIATDGPLAPRSMGMEFLTWWYGAAPGFSYHGDRLTWSWTRANVQAA